MTRRLLALMAALACIAACGKYGKPIRSDPGVEPAPPPIALDPAREEEEGEPFEEPAQ